MGRDQLFKTVQFLLFYTKEILKENQNPYLSLNKMSHILHDLSRDCQNAYIFWKQEGIFRFLCFIQNL